MAVTTAYMQQLLDELTRVAFSNDGCPACLIDTSRLSSFEGFEHTCELIIEEEPSA